MNRCFTSGFQTGEEVKASASVGFFGCEASLEVTTGFEYEATVSSETTQSWKQTLTEGTYIVYQNVPVYAHLFPSSESHMMILRNSNPRVHLKLLTDTITGAAFIPFNRDDPFTLHYQDAVWDSVEYDILTAYFASDPSKWFSN
ncbi:hypothetical protein ACTA71_011432 [Dictyostelium dimigraforme]